MDRRRREKMNRKKLTALLFALAVGLAFPALAHPPSDIVLDFNPKTATLNVKVMHNVMDPAMHYIKTVTVTVDGKEAAVKKITSQTSKATQETAIELKGVTKGSKITVKAECSIAGSKQAELTAP
jgi:hypothetical protein